MDAYGPTDGSKETDEKRAQTVSTDQRLSGEELRVRRIFAEIIRSVELDLAGLTIYTEAASGNYLFAPILAAEAGGHVIAVTSDSRYSPASRVEEQTRDAASRFGLDGQVHVVRRKCRDDVARADVVTNSGFVRPIDGTMIEWMKPTAVIPLMWEPWELRAEDLDLAACKAKGILVLGTDESAPGIEMTGYSGAIAVKLLLDLGLELVRTKVVLLGAQRTLGVVIYRYLTSVGCQVIWFGLDEPNAAPYSELTGFFNRNGGCDAIVVAEHEHPHLLLGEGGYLDYDTIRRNNPDVRVGVIAGALKPSELEVAGLRYAPGHIRPFGYMSYQPYELGPRPVLELFGAGLKVGATMARARLGGMSVAEAARFSLENSPALDLTGKDAWL